MAEPESNGQAPAAPVMVAFGPAADDVIPVTVASRMLTRLFEREDTLFTTLLAEAMTGVRLAKVRHRTQAADRLAGDSSDEDSSG